MQIQLAEKEGEIYGKIEDIERSRSRVADVHEILEEARFLREENSRITAKSDQISAELRNLKKKEASQNTFFQEKCALLLSEAEEKQ